MALADIIKIDFAASSRPEIEQLVNRVKQAPIRLLAEKIESNAEFDYARGLGFTLFQGYFFRRPEIVTAKRLTPLQSSFMQLLTKANQQPFDFDGLSQIISHDLSLVYSLLRLINSAAFGLRQKVTSIKQALVLLGEREIRKWISLLALQNISSGKPDELIRLSLIRARFIELIAVQTQCDDKTAAHCRQLSSEFFFAGLFSLLDVMLDRPLPVLLAEIEAPGIVKDCLLGKDPSAVALYQLIIAYEQGRWNDVAYHADALSVDHSAIADAYIGALHWYRSLAA